MLSENETSIITGTLVPEVFLDFSPLEIREPRSGDRYYDITSRESFFFLATSRLV